MSTNQDFAVALLNDAGLPTSQNNIQNVMAWMFQEQGDAWSHGNNPLNIGPGVNYPDLSAGAAGTASVLKQQNMSGIYGALKQNAPFGSFAGAVAGSPWGTGQINANPSSVPILSASGTITGSAGSGASAGGGNLGAPYTPSSIPGIPSIPPSFPDPTADPLTEISRVVSWGSEFAGWAFFTMLVFLFGAVLMLLGLVMLTILFVKPVTSPVGEAAGTLARNIPGEGAAAGVAYKVGQHTKGKARSKPNPSKAGRNAIQGARTGTKRVAAIGKSSKATQDAKPRQVKSDRYDEGYAHGVSSVSGIDQSKRVRVADISTEGGNRTATGSTSVGTKRRETPRSSSQRSKAA